MKRGEKVGLCHDSLTGDCHCVKDPKSQLDERLNKVVLFYLA